MSGKRILLVDDEAGILEIVGMRIKSWGYEGLGRFNYRGTLTLYVFIKTVQSFTL